jgi:hypothetical protein
MLVIGSKHSNSRVRGDVRLTSTGLDNPYNEKYERLTTYYEELRWVVMEKRLHIGDLCAPPYWPYSLGDDQPLPPSPPSMLTLF